MIVSRTLDRHRVHRFACHGSSLFCFFFFFPLHITSCSRHYYNRLSLILIFDAGTKIFRVDEENFHGFLDQKCTLSQSKLVNDFFSDRNILPILNIWRVILRKNLELEFSFDMKISSRHFIGYFGCHNESIHSLSNEKSPLLSVTSQTSCLYYHFYRRLITLIVVKAR